MLETVLNIFFAILFTSIIAFYLGFLFGKTRAIKSKSRINPIFKEQGNIYNKPLILGVPRPKGKDNLQEIDGIDSALEHELNDLGIFHFDQISKWSHKNYEWVEAFLNIQGQISSEKWISQALSLGSAKKGS